MGQAQRRRSKAVAQPLLLERLGQLIKDWRVSTGHSQASFCEHLGLTGGALSRWEAGLKTPSLHNLQTFCVLVGCDLETFWKGPAKAKKRVKQAA